MNRQEYAEQMKDLCRKQAELKTAHLNAVSDLDANAKKLIADIMENARVEKGKMKAKYRSEQLEIECAKQQLKADYLDEHPEEAKGESETE